MTVPPAARDYHGWVAQLRWSRRRHQARQLLSAAGPDALPAIRRGLGHPDATVRRLCVNLLDRLLDESSVAALVAALDDTDVEVRCRALHALACETCKDNACRPGEDLFVPRAIKFLSDPDPDVRAAAIDSLGKVAGHRSDAGAALIAAARNDPDRGLRSMASAGATQIGQAERTRLSGRRWDPPRSSGRPRWLATE